MDDEALDALIAFVGRHYGDPKWSNQPLYLATVGKDLGERRQALVEKFGSLANAVKAAGPDRLELLHMPDHPGRTAVVTPDKREAVEERLKVLISGESASGTSFQLLPLPLQLAFCVGADAGETIAVKLNPPIRYRRLAPGQAVPPGFVVVDGEYRIPGLKLSSASAGDLERLWRNYLAWAAKHGIEPDRPSRASPPANALERFLAAQDPLIVERIVLTGDIASILIRHR